VRKKILLVGWGYPPNIEGGLDIHVVRLFEELRNKEEIDVTMALPAINAPGEERTDIISIEAESNDIFGIAREMSQKIPQIADEYDIIHTHDWFGAETGFKCKKYCDVSWVSTIHSLCKNRSRSISETVGRLEKVACTEPDQLIAVSQILREDILKEHSVKSEVIYNGFSKPKTKGIDVKKELGIEGDMIFFVGRHAEQKGIEHLIYGFKKYLGEHDDCYLVLGGEGELKESYENFVKLLDIEDRVIFVGFVNEDILGDYYRCADVFVSSSFSEPFGLTITEALEMKTSVVATKSGVEEILPQNLIYSAEPTSDSLKNALKKALKEDTAPNQSFNSRDWSKMAEEIIEVYKSL